MQTALILSAGSLPQKFAGAERATQSLVPPGASPGRVALALLGQDPLTRWSGPAALGAAAAGIQLAEDESAYLLSPVRAEGGVILEELSLSPDAQVEVLEALREELCFEALQLAPGRPPILLVGRPLPGASTLEAEPLEGRSLSALPQGPAELLEGVVSASPDALADRGAGRATHLFPHCPSALSGAQPLRETWLGLGPSAVVGSSPLAKALATLLSLRHIPARPGQALQVAAREGAPYDLVVMLSEGEALEEEALAALPRWVWASTQADSAGKVSLLWRGGEQGKGSNLLQDLVLGGNP